MGTASELLARDNVSPMLPKYLDSIGTARGEIRTPNFGKAAMEVVRNAWDEVYFAHSSELPGRLAEYEESEREKMGPISGSIAKGERLEQVREYFNNRPDSYPSEALSIDTGFFQGRDLRPLSLDNAATALPSNTNSGFPYFTKKRLVRDLELENALQYAYDLLCAILFTRTAAGGPEPEDVRIRDLWGYPMSHSIREMALQRPWINAIRSHVALSALRGVDDVDKAVVAFMSAAVTANTPMYSTDFSGFDKSLGKEILLAFGNTLKNAFQGRIHGEIDFLMEVLVYIPLLMGRDLLLEGEHGMPSGSTLTNNGDSDVHRRGQLWVSRLVGSELNPFCQVQGDDGLLNFRDQIDENRMTEGWQSLHLNDNPEKRFVGMDDCMYLRRYYLHGLSHGMYPTYRALNSLLQQERFHDEEGWGPEMVTLRNLMILENTKWNPLFPYFAEFAASGDKFRLGAAWPGGIDGLLKPEVINRARSIVNFVPSYNQEDRIGGIRNFQIYKFVKEHERDWRGDSFWQ